MPPPDQLSVQLYTVRGALKEDFDGTLAKIAAFGYTQVEPFAFTTFFDDLKTGLSAHGLTAPTSHMGLLAADDQDAIFAAARELGITTVIAPSSPRTAWETADGIAGVAADLNAAAAKAAEYGLTVGYHNHEYELVSKIDGVHGLEVLAEQLDDAVVLEVDTYWAYVGGADVPALLDRLGERVVALHIKDGDGTLDNTKQVAVGSGSVPVHDFMAAAPAALFVVELDDSEGDLVEAVGASREFLVGSAAAGGCSLMAGKGPVGVGIIGAGVISGTYIENLKSFADVELLAIADIIPEIAAAKAAEYGVALHGANDVVLNHPDVELVINLTPPAAHTEVCGSAIAAGKHVWSEKPLGLTRESGKELLEAAEAAGLRVGCAPDTFLGSGLQAVNGVLAGGAIGRPLSALFLMQQPGPDLWHPNPAFLFQEGAGPLFDIGPYYFTAAVQMFGPVESVAAVGSKARERRKIHAGPKAGEEFDVTVPSQTTALVRFEGGQALTVVLSFDSAVPRILLEVTGTDASLEIPDPNMFDGEIRLRRPDGEDWEPLQSTVAKSQRGTGALDIARAIREDRPHRATGALAYHVLDIMVSIAEASESGQVVAVQSTVQPSEPLPADWDPLAATV